MIEASIYLLLASGALIGAGACLMVMALVLWFVL